MKRAEIERDYDVRGGIIHSPGKFEGEAVYVPYFWGAYLDGFADDDDGYSLRFDVTDEDRAEFPELADVSCVTLVEDSSGFIHASAR